MSTSIDAFTVGEIYIDTMMFYTLLRAEDRVRPLIQRFFSRIESGEILAHTSVREIREAVVQAGLKRIRPCLMTLSTTVFGLMPIFWATPDAAPT